MPEILVVRGSQELAPHHEDFSTMPGASLMVRWERQRPSNHEGGE